MALHLSTPVAALAGIGGTAEKDLRALGIVSVRDLLWHLPFRYEDYSVVKPIKNLCHDDTVTVTGRIRAIESRPSKNSRVTLTEAIVEDESGEMKVTWFNQPYLTKTLRAGSRVSLAGRVDSRFSGRAGSAFGGGLLTLVSPVWEPAGARVHTGRIVPVYGLSGSLTMRRLRAAIESALTVAEEMSEFLPAGLVADEGFPSRAAAVRAIHFPESRTALDAAIARLKFDELLIHQLMFAQVRHAREVQPSRVVPTDAEYLKAFVSSLPFPLTGAQRRAAWDVVKDCAKERPMNRLLEGDVGSGKTAVAAIAIAGVTHAGFAAAYLAPTEILASQQQVAITRFFAHVPMPGIGIGLLTASQARIGEEEVSRRVLLEAVSEGRVQCLVGTHALLQGIDIPNLALVVVDEQHRFGVQQRKALLDRTPAPHLLSMTATPIPRSLALTIYGDLDLSVLGEMPAGRKPVATRLAFSGKVGSGFAGDKAKEMWDHVAGEIRDGRQVFVVCPLIDPSDTLGGKSVTEVAKTVANVLPKTVRVGVLHGKLPSDEKAAAIDAFRSGQTDVLVSTTVVEVGVDVPNASVMVIVGAERFGLSQLHQLRGRVGRSDIQSHCYLVPNGWTPSAKERLSAMTRTNNGFELAEIDLKLRGAGNVFGTAQSGFPDFKLANESDIPLMKKTRDIAARLLAEDPELDREPLLREQVRQEFDQVHLE